MRHLTVYCSIPPVRGTAAYVDLLLMLYHHPPPTTNLTLESIRVEGSVNVLSDSTGLSRFKWVAGRIRLGILGESHALLPGDQGRLTRKYSK